MMNDLKPIRSEADYQAALAEVERLWGAKSGTPEGDRLEIVATLVDAYENEHEPMDPPDPIEAIVFRMEQQGLTRRDLEALLGSRARVAEILNRKRDLSIHMIRRLHETLGISAEVLIRPTRKSAA
jgi:HTH-type transcriptional regulator/antitoxin HigA